MMGRLNRDQGQLFYSFCLDEAVPDDHRVRDIAAVLDLSWVHAELAQSAATPLLVALRRRPLSATCAANETYAGSSPAKQPNFGYSLRPPRCSPPPQQENQP